MSRMLAQKDCGKIMQLAMKTLASAKSMVSKVQVILKEVIMLI
jgi:hypothetical protein